MYNIYVSIAQSYSTQYLAAQVEQVKHQKIKYKAFREVLKTRLFLNSRSNNGRENKK